MKVTDKNSSSILHCDPPNTPTQISQFSQLSEGDDTLKMLAAFNLFPDLTPELRVRIWKMTAMVPRFLHPYARHCGPPAVLHTNRESRHEALKEYTLIKIRFQYRILSLFINFENDILFCPGFSVNSTHGGFIRKLAIDVNVATLLSFPSPIQTLWREVEKSYPNLSELVITSSDIVQCSKVEDLAVSDTSISFTKKKVESIMAWFAKEKAAGRGRNFMVTFMGPKKPDTGIFHMERSEEEPKRYL